VVTVDTHAIAADCAIKANVILPRSPKYSLVLHLLCFLIYFLPSYVPKILTSLACGAIVGTVYAVIEAGVALYPIIQAVRNQQIAKKTATMQVAKVAGKVGVAAAVATGVEYLANDSSIKVVGQTAGTIIQHSTVVVSLLFFTVSSIYTIMQWPRNLNMKGMLKSEELRMRIGKI
jgi:hypothetical protein